MRSESVLNTGTFVPVALGCVPSPVDMFPYLETLRTLYYWDFTEAHPVGVINL